MVLRQFAAFDNEAFRVDPSSPFLTSGSPIINNSSTPVGTIFTFTPGFEYQSIQLEDTSSDPDTFNDDDEDNHVIVEGRGLVANGTEVESESYHYVRALDANGDPTGPQITITVFSQNGQTSNVWGMASDTQLQPGVRYEKVGGSNNGDSLYEDFVPCFTSGTLISVRGNQVPIEMLSPGDKIMTRDNGFQEIRWIGRKTLSPAKLAADARFRPVRIRAGALGDGNPQQDLIVSPNHRVLLTGKEYELEFAMSEILVAAKHLVGLPGIEQVVEGGVTYVHLLFDRHEVVSSHGQWTESFLPGQQSLEGIGNGQAEEIFALFPELRDSGLPMRFPAARPMLSGREAELVRARMRVC